LAYQNSCLSAKSFLTKIKPGDDIGHSKAIRLDIALNSRNRAMDQALKDTIKLDVGEPIWDHFYFVAPLVVVGTKEGDNYDLAPKHMAMPMGWDNYFGFVCTPRHQTYHNIKKEGTFTVSFPRPNHVLMASLAASHRCDDPVEKPIIQELETFPSEITDGIFLKESYLYLECELDRFIDGFGVNSLITGKIISARVDHDAMRSSDEDDQKRIFDSPLLAYLQPGRFTSIKETFAFPFPAKFER